MVWDIRDETRRHGGRVGINFLVEEWIGARMWGERFSKFWTWGGKILFSPSVGIVALYKSLLDQATYSYFFLQLVETNRHAAS